MRSFRRFKSSPFLARSALTPSKSPLNDAVQKATDSGSAMAVCASKRANDERDCVRLSMRRLRDDSRQSPQRAVSAVVALFPVPFLDKINFESKNKILNFYSLSAIKSTRIQHIDWSLTHSPCCNLPDVYDVYFMISSALSFKGGGNTKS